VDVETRDEQLRELGPGVRRPGCYVVGVSFAIEDGPCCYLPIRHATGINLDEDVVLSYLRDQAKVFKGELVGANLSYDLDYLEEEGVRFHQARCCDIQLNEPLIDDLQDSYSMDAIAERRGIPGKDQTLLQEAAKAYGLNPKRDLWRLPPEYVGPYGEQDVLLPLQILRQQEADIEQKNLQQIVDLESRLLPITVQMRRRGVRIDFKRLEEVQSWALQKEREKLAEIRRLTDVSLTPDDVWKAEALAQPLRQIGIEPPTTPKTNKPSIRGLWLETIDHDVAKLIIRARKFNKLRTTFAASIIRHSINGRIHCTFNQLRGPKSDEDDSEQGARWGRMSCVDPNLQQQISPDKDPEIGKPWRSIYVPEEGCEWLCADYSQQEPRWSVHYAEQADCSGAREAAERYRSDPDSDFHSMMVELTGLKRSFAKIIFLGLIYGMGEAKLCHQAGLETKWVFSKRRQKMVEIAGPKGQAILEQFHRRVPWARQIADIAKEKANNTGSIRTILGRMCHFPPLPPDEHGNPRHDWTHKALNRAVQGSSGDQTKMALILAEEAGFKVQLQVHDELDLSVSDRKQSEELAEIMRKGVECSVPHKVDLEHGPSWGEIEKVG